MSSSEIDHPRQRVAALGRTLRSQLIILGTFVLLFWFLELLDSLLLHGGLDALGVQPRTLVGLRGIIFMPFLHDGFGHVLANTVPFIVLGWLVMVRRTADFFVVTAITVLVSGLGVWIFGGNGSVHIGASGLIFGYFGFLLLRAYFERSLPAIAVAVVVGVLYGGLIWGVLPMQLGVSWQAHLFGFIGGVLAAYWLSREPRY
jgi:membrane associated rhomboid family serine protease